MFMFNSASIASCVIDTLPTNAYVHCEIGATSSTCLISFAAVLAFESAQSL